MKTLLHIIAAAVIWCLVAAIAAAESAEPDLNETFAPYAALLRDFLRKKDLDGDGYVSAFDYRAALSDETTAERLKEQDALLAEFAIARLDSRELALAFWNNAYNYFMIQKILTDPGDSLVDSVWDYGGRYNPFRANVFERELFDIGGKKYSLDNMEKDIMLGDDFRKKGWWDARVHFTVNCASVGCPPLRQQIYTAANIDDYLAENTRRAFNTHYHLRLDGDTLYLTELFRWYRGHFEESAGSAREFIKQHGDEAVAEKIGDTRRIRYIDYDWRLNKPDNFAEFE